MTMKCYLQKTAMIVIFLTI